MKITKNFTTGILFGIGLIVVPLILMSGSTVYTTEKQNLYEFHHANNPNNDGYILNTHTGDIYYLNRAAGWKKRFQSK